LNFRIPFNGRQHSYTDLEIAAAITSMKIAEPLTQGYYLAEFERKFAMYAGVEFVFAVSNATMALELAAKMCQLSPGDEVIIPSHTFTSSAYPFLKTGATPVWADIDLQTRVVCPETIIKCLTEKTKVIVVPHLYGYGADMPSICKIAKDNGILVVEDAAQALGVSIENQMVGSFADFGVFSFHSHKNISTLGEGGILTVSNKELAELVPMLRHNGHCGFPFDRTDYWLPAMGNVDIPQLNGKNIWPVNCCIGEVSCAVGTELLNRIDAINAEKRTRAIHFIDSLSDYSDLIFHRELSNRHNYHLLVAQITKRLRDPFIRTMAATHGIQCVVQYYPLNRYEFYKSLGFGHAECPNTDLFFDSMVSFPFHHNLTDYNFEEIISATKNTLEYLNCH
jgi:dTDP-4-amino-4,6-dideoxygalactose transaminase